MKADKFDLSGYIDHHLIELEYICSSPTSPVKDLSTNEGAYAQQQLELSVEDDALVDALKKSLSSKLSKLLVKSKELLENAKNEAPSHSGVSGEQIKDSLDSSLTTLKKLAELQDIAVSGSASVTERLNEVKPIILKLQPLMQQLRQENRAITYIQKAKIAENLRLLSSKSLSANENKASAENRTDEFIELVSALSKEHKLLMDTQDKLNLEKVITERVKTISLELRDELYPELKVALEKLKWPITATRQSLSNDPSVLRRVRRIFEKLVNLQLIYMRSEIENDEEEMIEDIWGLEVFLDPIVKRFRYHFGGKRKTNRADKPEWFITFVMNVIKDHHKIVSDVIQRIAESVCASFDLGVFFDTLSQFIRALISKCIFWRLEKSYSSLESSDTLLCHSIDQIISADLQLKDDYDYGTGIDTLSWPTMISFFSNDDERRQKWVRADFLTSYERIQAIISDSGAWVTQQSIRPKYLLAGMKKKHESVGCVPESCNEMLNLLQKIAHRFTNLLLPEQGFPFISNVQLPILATYRVAVNQQLLEPVRTIKRNPLSYPEKIRMFCVGINALLHIGLVLVDWANEEVYSSIRDYQLRSATTTKTSRIAILGKSRDIVNTIQSGIRNNKYQREILNSVVPSVFGSLWKRGGDSDLRRDEVENVDELEEDGKGSAADDVDIDKVEMKTDSPGGVFASEVYQLNVLYSSSNKHLVNITVSQFITETSSRLPKVRQYLKQLEETDSTHIFSRNAKINLSDALSIFDEQLHPDSLNEVVGEIARDISGFIIKFIIEGQVFSLTGALLLERECKKLYTAFQKFSKRPENRYFRDLKEHLTLLALPKNSLFSLVQALRRVFEAHGNSGNPDDESVRLMLQDGYHISSLSTLDALSICLQRQELK